MTKPIVIARRLSGNKDVQIQTIATLSSSIAHELKKLSRGNQYLR